MAHSISPTENLNGTAAIEKLKELCEKARTCMFTTDLKSESPSSRPMTLQGVCDKGRLHFISSTENQCNKDIQADNRVMLHFANNSNYEFVHIVGNAAITQDKSMIEKYWTNFANAWFDGKDDPRVSIISVTPDDSYYWDTKDGKIVAFTKMMFAAVTGKQIEDGGVEGTLSV